MLRPRPRATAPDLGDEDGSTLLLYPFAVLMVLAIGAIAIDAALLFQVRRQAVDVAAGLAADVAGVVDEAAFATDGVVRIDAGQAGELVAFTNEVALVDHPDDLRCGVTLSSDATVVEATCTGAGRALLLPIGGGPDGFVVTASAVASPVVRD